MKKVLAVLFTLLATSLFATQVNEQIAKSVALNYFNLNSQIQAVDDSLVYSNRTFYVFNTINTKGFVIVSAYDNTEPILAYSTESSFDTLGINEIGVKDWMNTVSEKISIINASNLQADSRIQNLWSSYLANINPNSNRAGSVAPLITTTWSQSPYYNALCPLDPVLNKRAVVGCVATAMAQIMRFWSSPIQGAGSYSYVHPKFGNISANFGSTIYNWSNMPNSISSNNTDVATISYHCGVAVAMDYGVYGSGAWVMQTDARGTNPCAQRAYYTYFGYNPYTLQDLWQDNYTPQAWIALIQNELNAGRPIQYQGTDMAAFVGHTWICDGYQSDQLFHMNWGWGGSYNGYYSLSSLTGGGYTWSSRDAVLVGIEPYSLSNCHPPTTLSVSGITSTSAVLNWDVVAGATGYTITINEKDSITLTNYTSTTTTYTLNNLKQGAIYQWKVKPICSSPSYYSTTNLFVTNGLVCGIPTQLFPCSSCQVVRLNQVTAISNVLYWAAVPSAESYHVQYRKVGTTNWIDASTTGLSVTISGLIPLTTYEWKVQSICYGGSASNFAIGGNFTTKAVPACSVPISMATSSIKSNSAYCSWSYSNYKYAKYSSFRYKPVSSPTWITYDTVCTLCSSTPYFSFISSCNSCLTSNTQYEWQVSQACINSSGGCCNQSGWTNSTYFTTTSCDPIGSVAIGNVTSTSAIIAWGATSSGSYKLYYKLSTNSSWTKINTTVNTYTINGLQTGKTYNYTIGNICGTDTSALYAIQSFTTSSCSSYPTGLSTKNISYSSATLSWVLDANGDGYNVQWRKIGTTTWSSATVNSNNTTYYNTFSLLPNTDYEWQVATKCGSLYSSFSPLISFRTTSSCQSTYKTAQYILSNTQVYIGWYNVGSTSYTVAYHPVGTSTWSYTTSTGLNTTITVTPATNYEWKVRSNCGTDTSLYSPAYTFNTVNLNSYIPEEKKFNIFPNPSDGTFTITGNGRMEVKVYDIQGKLLFDDICIDECVITTKFPCGVYVLKVNNKSYKLIING